MRSLVVILSGLAVCGAAHAELLANKGQKGTLSVQYEYSAVRSREERNEPSEWRVQRTVKLVVAMIADSPTPASSLRPVDTPGAAEPEKLRELQKTMTPTVTDMMKIGERCGDDDACIERALQDYGDTMDKPALEKGRAQSAEMNAGSGPRYQRWQPVSQQGSYSVDEIYRSGILSPACKDKPRQRCTHEETRKGAGEIPPAAGSKHVSAAMFEVDSRGKTALIKLPVPSSGLAYTRELTSELPGEKSGTSPGKVPPLTGPQKLITFPLADDLRTASGTHTYQVDGERGEGGTMKVTWQFALQK